MLFVAAVILAVLCVALKSAQIHSKVDQLWVQAGGRLERELQYVAEVLGESTSTTHQMVIQLPKHQGANILNSQALLEHLAILKAATHVSVNLFDTTWKLKDLCIAPSVPNFETHMIDKIFESFIPCTIITPLDCFWEGSKLLGPDWPVSMPEVDPTKSLSWKNLNPVEMLESMKKHDFSFPFKTLEDYMKRAGITNGYQTKPCLNPKDPECPDTAPNKHSQQVPDIGAELSGGCYGFAANYMHWPEQLIIGGARHNKSGGLSRAGALQSVIQLMSVRELHEYTDVWMTQHFDWTPEKANQVLEAWQAAFSREVGQIQNASENSGPYSMIPFSSSNLDEILSRHSKFSPVRIAEGCGAIVLYAGLALFCWKDRVRSQAGVGMAGVLLVCLTLAASFGFCSIVGIPFNAASFQVVPFLCLGLGVHDIFLLTRAYAKLSAKEVPKHEQTGVVLKRAGLSVLFAGLANVAGFFVAAYFFPVPALRVFCLQAGCLRLFTLAAILFVFPAMMSIDLRRRRSGRSDILCCCLPERVLPDRRRACAKHHDHQHQRMLPQHQQYQQHQHQQCQQHAQHAEGKEHDSLTGHYPHDWGFSLTKMASQYAPIVTNVYVKFFGMLMLAMLLGGSAWYAMRVEDGLDLTEVVPDNSDEFRFLDAQSKYFGFYSMFAVTGRDFDYPNNQRLLYEYHDAFMRVKRVIKNDDGGLPEFWLGMFRDWLRRLQATFDREYRSNCITSEGWCKNATDDGILAYKLLVQTGHVDNPIDKSLVTQVRLVDSDGIINPRAFYNYLSAWATNDGFAYGASQAQLRPKPKEWFYGNDPELKIPKSMPLTYAQMPFYLHKLSHTAEISEMINSVRRLCKRFEERGLPNFPSGIPFVFWEPYTDLRNCLGVALLAALGISVAVVGLLLLNLWAAILVGTALAGVVLQLFGFMGLFGLKLNVVSAALLVVSVGIAVHSIVHLCLSFVTTVGGRDRRLRLSLEHMTAPVLHGIVATLLAVAMLARSDFVFIVNYFFMVLLSLVLIGLLNGFFFFPILLSLAGPSSEVIPFEHPDRISTPTPPMSPVLRRSSKPPAPPRRHSSYKIENARLHAEPSLTTITEEPNSWHSQQESCIIVQPDIKVETSTCPNQNCSGSDTSGSSRTSPIPTTTVNHITTKVTATVTAKVEVHTPLTIVGGMERSEKCRHTSGRRSSRCNTSVNTESSGSSSEPDSDTNTNNKR